ncbi:hypothetical protein A2U01_0073767, partial [Trifolium medium]|nr:hypothetical protein [Trifolium medium]
GDITAAIRCFEVAAKNQNSIVTPEKDMGGQKQMPAVNTIG